MFGNEARAFHGSIAGTVQMMLGGSGINLTISLTDAMSATSGGRKSPGGGGYDPSNPHKSLFMKDNPYGQDGSFRTIQILYNLHYSFPKEDLNPACREQ
jgi:hypothetical protein